MAEALATITEITGPGMIQIRADLGRAAAAIAAATGLSVPGPNMTSADAGRRLCWMSPDELLLVVPADETAGLVAKLSGALAAGHALVVDVSDMRAAFRIEGPRSEQVLMKLCPTDVAAIPRGGIRRTRAAQVACGIWRDETGFVLIGFRSVADYLQGILAVAARPGTALDPR